MPYCDQINNFRGCIMRIRRTTRFFYPAFMLLIPLFLSCAGGDAGLDVSGWEILHDNDRSISSAMAKTGWKPVSVPSTFRIPVDTGNKKMSGARYFWLRGTLTIRNSPENFYGITMGRVYDTDSVYINGYQIGSMENDEIGLIRQRRNYVIPRGVLRSGENNVYINLGAYSADRAGITSVVRILPRREYEIVSLISTFFYFHLPLEMMVIASLISVVLGIFFLWNRKEHLYLYSLFAVLLYILFLVSLFYPFSVVNAALTRAINWSSYYLFAIALILIIQSLFGIYVPVYNYACIPIFFLFTALVLLLRNTGGIFYIANALAVMTELILVPVTVVMITRFHRARRDRFKAVAALLISVVGIGVACLEIAFSLAGGAYSLFVTAYCAPFFLLLFVIIFAREQMKKNLELELLYRRLKINSKGNEGASLNEAAKEKLDRVTDFIRENYTSDLSREGLAAAVGMNPNYMSGLFKQYAGIKVNEYINRLRIEDALKKLEDPEVKVIDVALSVGFESLSTFNRAFKKEVGRTPTEYRESAS